MHIFKETIMHFVQTFRYKIEAKVWIGTRLQDGL